MVWRYLISLISLRIFRNALWFDTSGAPNSSKTLQRAGALRLQTNHKAFDCPVHFQQAWHRDDQIGRRPKRPQSGGRHVLLQLKRESCKLKPWLGQWRIVSWLLMVVDMWSGIRGQPRLTTVDMSLEIRGQRLPRKSL
jgi:hypothetical protein